MKIMRLTQTFILLIILSGCSSLTLSSVKYAWPIESVLMTDDNGNVEEPRYSMTINMSAMIIEEFGTGHKIDSFEVRIIRNDEGYYFITAPNFKNVYVFEESGSSLNLEKKLLLAPQGLDAPVMNQRTPFIELIDGDEIFMLTNKGFERK